MRLEVRPATAAGQRSGGIAVGSAEDSREFDPLSTASNPAIPAGAPAVSLSEVTKIYGRFAALRQVTMEFVPHRVYAIFGDNGAGKSTLLRVLAGLIQPTHGTLEVLGSRNIRDVTGRIGYMAHASLLYEELSAMENLRYFAGLYGIPSDVRCADVIRTVGLDPELTRYVGQYSQGMRQRLSMARAILHDPELLLLDEPFSNVDVHSARHMAGLLAQMRDAGKTIFVITHQIQQLEGIADESVLMDSGRIVARERGIEAAPTAAREVRA